MTSARDPLQLLLFPDPRDTTLARTTQVVGLFVVTLRLGTLVLMVPSAVVAVGVSSRPGLCVASWVVAIVAALVTTGLCLVRRRPPGGAWAVVDVAGAVAVLLVGIVTVPSEFRSGSWVGFQPGYALSVACSLVGVRRTATWAAAVGVIAVAQAAYLGPLFRSHPVDVTTAVGDMLVLFVLPPLTWAGSRSLLGLACTADENRALAVAASQEAEARQGRVAVHNAAAMMRLLLDLDGRPADGGVAGQTAHAQLVRQASDELARMRSYLRRGGHDPDPDAHLPPSTSPATLAMVVALIAHEFTDLDIAVQTDLAPSVTLSREVRGDLSGALRSLLLNVREHAHARRVVLHAEELDGSRTWRLTVHDDGRGFDTAHVRWGTGLSDVVAGQLDGHGIGVVVDSFPGVGTTVTLTNAA